MIYDGERLLKRGRYGKGVIAFDFALCLLLWEDYCSFSQRGVILLLVQR